MELCVPLRAPGLIRRLRLPGTVQQRLSTAAAALERASHDTRVRFLIAGSFATAINWLIRFPLNLVMPFAAAVTLATLTHMMVAFVLYRLWVFPGSKRGTVQQVRDFILVNAVGMTVTVAVSVGLCECLVSAELAESIAAAAAHILGIAAGAVATYLGHGRLTFR